MDNNQDITVEELKVLIDGGEKFNLKPAGVAVEVPNDASKTAYVQHLLDSGDVLILSKPKAVKPKSDEKEDI